MKCPHCQSVMHVSFVDLGACPPSNAFLNEAMLHAAETYYPLRVLVCSKCWLVQTEDYTGAKDLFSADYAYFSSFSDTWLAHAKQYVDSIESRFGIDGASLVVELAANDGYLLQYVKEKSISCLGVEPTASTARAARAKGLDIIEEFFGTDLANRMVRDGKSADLIIGNNVLAHVPDINDFVKGVATLLKRTGVATFEFPHLAKLIENGAFDTIYHEHFSYLSLCSVKRIFQQNGLEVFDVDELSTHGGSIRVCAQTTYGIRPVNRSVASTLASELAAGMEREDTYKGFQKRTEILKNDFLEFLLGAKRNNQMVVAYGAAAKGNTFLNYAGIRNDLIAFVADRSHAKQGKYLPGCRIPVVGERALSQAKPRFVVIFPWNLREEIVNQLGYIRAWGGRFVTAIPSLRVD